MLIERRAYRDDMPGLFVRIGRTADAAGRQHVLKNVGVGSIRCGKASDRQHLSDNMASSSLPLGADMQNFGIVVSATVALGATLGIGPASSADLPVRAYHKAPAMTADPAY